MAFTLFNNQWNCLYFFCLLCIANAATTTTTTTTHPSFSRLLPPRPPFKRASRYGGSHALASTSLPSTHKQRDLISHCEQRWRDTRLDHFTFQPTSAIGAGTFKHRYFICLTENYQSGGPIFFYTGNEADVTLYLNNTGLLWDMAPRHNALLVFAEHRYYGLSKPFEGGDAEYRNASTMAWLTTEQAMADYAELIFELKQELKDPDVPVIVAGGSYGGMLATWMRLKYPHLVDGALAGSAPIWSYYYEQPPWDEGAFAEIVTRDASPGDVAGAAPACVANVRAAWKTMFDWGKTEEGRVRIATAMRLCGGAAGGASAGGGLMSEGDVEAVADWAAGAFDYLAMGDYPYASSYILNGEGVLPAYPMRAACQHLAAPDLQGEALLSSLASGIGVFYNFTGQLECYDYTIGSDDDAGASNDATEDDATFWSWQWCTEQFMPMSRDGIRDMFWPQPFNATAASDLCYQTWGVRPQPAKPTIEWGGRRIESSSNIVFTNGGLDPWSSGGVLKTISKSKSLIAVMIPEGAHHLDLMFANDEDPESVTYARNVQENAVKRWIQEARARKWKYSASAERKKGGEGGVLTKSSSSENENDVSTVGLLADSRGFV